MLNGDTKGLFGDNCMSAGLSSKEGLVFGYSVVFRAEIDAGKKHQGVTTE